MQHRTPIICPPCERILQRNRYGTCPHRYTTKGTHGGKFFRVVARAPSFLSSGTKTRTPTPGVVELGCVSRPGSCPGTLYVRKAHGPYPLWRQPQDRAPFQHGGSPPLGRLPFIHVVLRKALVEGQWIPVIQMPVGDGGQLTRPRVPQPPGGCSRPTPLNLD
jgi:hypothetical protein